MRDLTNPPQIQICLPTFVHDCDTYEHLLFDDPVEYNPGFGSC